MSQDHLHHYLPLQTTGVVAYALGPVHCKKFELATEYFLERLVSRGSSFMLITDKAIQLSGPLPL